MKSATRVHLSPRSREAQLMLVVVVLAAWTAIGFAIFPRGHEALSAPGRHRPSLAQPPSIPARSVRV